MLLVLENMQSLVDVRETFYFSPRGFLPICDTNTLNHRFSS